MLVTFNSILVSPDVNLETLPALYPWLLEQKLVVKPDQLFGKRGKLGLVLLDADYEQVKNFIKNHSQQDITIGKATDKLTHFIIEPFVQHEREYYIAITSERQQNKIYFSGEGGINIEKQWSKVRILSSGVLESLQEEKIKEHFSLQEGVIISVIKALYSLFCDLNFTYLELNPFTMTSDGQINVLDTVVSVDSCALFQQHKNWGLESFPMPFGQKTSSEEKYIAKLNENSGASLKLTVLNPQGRIWNILSGGGASVIFLDALVDLDAGKEIANYGEYSGNPTVEESYNYAKTILDLMTRERNPKGKILLIGGAIANFTDVEKTFMGITTALVEYGDKLKEHAVSLYVRRGGPNYEKGLMLIENASRKIGVPCKVYGPETAMVHIALVAVEKLNQ